MFNNIVTYHVHKQTPLPPNDALAYQYILAGNGLFIRAETRFFNCLMPITRSNVRGLVPLQGRFRLNVPRLPDRLLATVLADARRARQPDGGLNEALYQFHHHGHTVQVKKPPQQTTPISVQAAAGREPAIICELHSHGTMKAFWSPTDNADEQGARLYAVIGRLDSRPEMRLRVGAYGYWHPLPVTAVFAGAGSFKDLYLKE